MNKLFLIFVLSLSLVNASEHDDYKQQDDEVVINIDGSEETEVEMSEIKEMQIAELVNLKKELEESAFEITRMRKIIEDLNNQGCNNCEQLRSENVRLNQEVFRFKNNMNRVESIKKNWACCSKINCSCFSGLINWFKNLRCCYKKQRNH